MENGELCKENCTHCRSFIAAIFGVVVVSNGWIRTVLLLDLPQTIKEDRPLKPLLLDLTVQTGDSQSRRIVVCLDLLRTTTQRNALLSVCLLYRGWEGRMLGRRGSCT